jgi:hypothetical protein
VLSCPASEDVFVDKIVCSFYEAIRHSCAALKCCSICCSCSSNQCASNAEMCKLERKKKTTQLCVPAIYAVLRALILVSKGDIFSLRTLEVEVAALDKLTVDSITNVSASCDDCGRLTRSIRARDQLWADLQCLGSVRQWSLQLTSLSSSSSCKCKRCAYALKEMDNLLLKRGNRRGSNPLPMADGVCDGTFNYNFILFIYVVLTKFEIPTYYLQCHC